MMKYIKQCQYVKKNISTLFKQDNVEKNKI